MADGVSGAVLADRPSKESIPELAAVRSGQSPNVIDDLADTTWDRELEDLFLRIGHRFGRADLRRRMWDYVRALLGPVGRKNGWQLAEYAGHRTLYDLQRLLDGATWSADDVRDDPQTYVAEKRGDDGVLIP